MAKWNLINGSLNRISVGSRTNVWGVNSAGEIYRYTQDDANPWIQVPGTLTDIGAAADGTVWGVNSAGNSYRYSGDGTWTPIGGSVQVQRISVGSRTNVWGLSSPGISTIVRYSQDDDNPWIQQYLGNLSSDIGAAADGTMWSVGSDGTIWRYLDTGTFTQVNGVLNRISVGSRTNVWGLNSAGEIYIYTQNDKNPFTQVSGPPLSEIGAAADGTVWGVISSAAIYRYDCSSSQ